MTPCSDAYFASPLALRTPGKQCGLTATGVYQPSLRSPWLEANETTAIKNRNPSSAANGLTCLLGHFCYYVR
ncbi:MAG: hypothetical protein GY814_19075 [Gammaproteobacteria bacterium]|nr:hypothetical protein [Gammaproteobacteria bacterium]